MVKNPPANAGDIRDTGLIPGSGRSPGEGNGNPRQYSCLENPMDIGAWWATVHGGRKESDMTERLSTYTHNLCRFSSECFLIVQNPLKCLLVVLVSFGCYNKLPQTR